MSILDELNELSDPSESNAYPARLEYLKTKKKPFSESDISKIVQGVDDVTHQLKQGHSSFVVYGEPQSGKTEFMIAMTCKLFDLGYETIFILMNNLR